jgi:hypothetical protein
VEVQKMVTRYLNIPLIFTANTGSKRNSLRSSTPLEFDFVLKSSKESPDYRLPSHMGTLRNDHVTQIALDSALIGLCKDNNIKTWGETQEVKMADSLLTPATSFAHLEKQVTFSYFSQLII